MRVRLDKIKFKEGLQSKRRKVTGKIDLKLSKITSKPFSSNLQYKLNDKIAWSIKFRKGLLYEAVTVHGNWQKRYHLDLGNGFLILWPSIINVMFWISRNPQIKMNKFL